MSYESIKTGEPVVNVVEQGHVEDQKLGWYGYVQYQLGSRDD